MIFSHLFQHFPHNDLALQQGAAAMAWKRLVAAERSACGKMRKNPHKQCIAYHVSYGYGSNKFKKQIWMIWIATRWSGRVERRSYANDLKWFLSLQKGMDRGYGSPVHAGYGSGPYILSCSHISDCLIHCNILVHLSYFIMSSDMILTRFD